MAVCGRLVFQKTRMADLLAVAPHSASFLKDLASGWASHGHAAMEKTAINQSFLDPRALEHPPEAWTARGFFLWLSAICGKLLQRIGVTKR